ncbi:hypothetical protein DFH06DRAFT_1135564 [Mycena polygramma]|nr:hypothetical protein DFH06DRAFT_1135564 [Mycena polygramma]
MNSPSFPQAIALSMCNDSLAPNRVQDKIQNLLGDIRIQDWIREASATICEDKAHFISHPMAADVNGFGRRLSPSGPTRTQDKEYVASLRSILMAPCSQDKPFGPASELQSLRSEPCGERSPRADPGPQPCSRMWGVGFELVGKIKRVINGQASSAQLFRSSVLRTELYIPDDVAAADSPEPSPFAARTRIAAVASTQAPTHAAVVSRGADGFATIAGAAQFDARLKESTALMLNQVLVKRDSRHLPLVQYHLLPETTMVADEEMPDKLQSYKQTVQHQNRISFVVLTDRG